MTSTYTFAAAPHVRDQLAHLQACLDPITIMQLELLGVDAGWRCLEVGAGGGSIAVWLAHRAGQVTATDLDVTHLRPDGNLRVLRHDIAADPLPHRAWDLIHARLVLQHLPQRRRIVSKLAAGLRPGGWLLLEDFDCRHLPVAAASTAEAAELFRSVTSAVLSVLEDAGADVTWGTSTYEAMRAAGLSDVSAHARTGVWAGGTAGCLLHATNTRQLTSELRRKGLTESTLERFRALMGDPAFAAPFYLLVSTRGRRGR